MDLKKALIAVAITGIMMFPGLACRNSVQTTAPIETTAVPAETAVPPARPAEGEMPAPPADNGTMPAPPEGFTPGARPAAPEIDWAAAAASLGVTEEQLKAAVGDFEGGMFDMETAAATLGVTIEALQEALGLPSGGAPPQEAPPEGAE